MNKKVTLLLTVLLSMVGLQALADWNTSKTVLVDGLYYYLDKGNLQAQVTSMPEGKYTGDISIPIEVTSEGKVYTVTSIGYTAFALCTDLTSITIPNSVTSIGEGAFNFCSGLTSVTIGNSVSNICMGAFNHCTGLTSITIPNSVTSIDEGAFYFCTGLTSITIPSSVTSIGIYAFEGCSGLTSVTIPNSLTSISQAAFCACTNLVSVTIPSSVTSIGDAAFYVCLGLTSVTMLNPTPVTITNDTFTNRENATLYVPQGSKRAYQTADYWKEFKEIVEIDPAKINQIMSNESPENTIFTLDGKRIYKLQKGLNIIGGKKVVIK